MEKKKEIKQGYIPRKRINISKEFRTESRMRKNYETKLRREMRKFFEYFYWQYAYEMETNMQFDLVYMESAKELRTILDNHYRTVIRAFGLRMLESFKKETDQFELIYKEYSRENVAEKVTMISNTQRNRIKRITCSSQS